jgi:hypothetical protein
LSEKFLIQNSLAFSFKNFLFYLFMQYFMPVAKSLEFLFLASQPVFLCKIKSLIPELLKATTGTLQEFASNKILGELSINDGITTTSDIE